MSFNYADATDLPDYIVDDTPWFKSYEMAILWEQSYYVTWLEEDSADNAEDFDDADAFREYYHTRVPDGFCFDAPAVGYIL